MPRPSPDAARTRARHWLCAMLLGMVLAVSSACSGSEPELVAAETAAPELASPTPTPAPTPVTVPTDTPTATPIPTPTPTATPTPRCLETIDPELLVAQVLMPLAVPTELALVTEMAEAGHIGAVGLLGSPTEGEMLAFAARTAEVSPHLLVASDEEGGRVQRLAAAAGPLPSAEALARLDPAEVVATFEAYGRRLRSLGVHMALAPVVDVGGGPGIGDRSFGSDPAEVTTYAAAVVEGYRRGGIIPVLKHFPGHGRASQDTHDGIATTPTLDELRMVDLVPFVDLARADQVAIMVGHLLVPGLTEDVPTSLAPVAIDGLLRGELGFSGFVITDALGMGAVAQTWDQPTAAVLALQAGADMVILDDLRAVEPTREALLDALAASELTRGRLEAAVERNLTLRGIDPCALGAPA